jgi:hypothetical protein
MEKNILKKSGSGYWQLNSTSLKADILINFLTSDVVIPNKWIAWLNNPERQYNSSNLTYMEKKDGDIIELSDLFSEEGPFLAIKKSKLIEVLEQWESLTKQRPHYIVITLDGDDIHMEGTNNMEFSEQSFIAVRKEDTYYLKKSWSPLGWLWWKFLEKDVDGEVDPWLAWFNDPQQREIVSSRFDIYARIKKRETVCYLGKCIHRMVLSMCLNKTI